MATFKVGQRVRIVRASKEPRFVGREATIVEIPASGGLGDCSVDIDGELEPKGWPGWAAFFGQLAPLLPPDEAADAFLARLKKLGSEPVNDAPKVTERVNS